MGVIRDDLDVHSNTAVVPTIVWSSNNMQVPVIKGVNHHALCPKWALARHAENGDV